MDERVSLEHGMFWRVIFTFMVFKSSSVNSLKINEMPSGEQELLLYSGDSKVISTLQEVETPVEEYVVSTFVNLPKGDDLEWQGMTYTPPTLPKSVK